MRGPALRRSLVKIEHREPKLMQMVAAWYATGAEARLKFEYTTDGAESINSIAGSSVCTRAHWVGEELVIESSMEAAGRTLHFKDCWSLSNGGRRLTMEHRDDDLAGQISVLDRVDPQGVTVFDEL